ncbi:UPF0149 family protein [Thalassotalea euphylliae]|uniref:YecA family protein n=1 Tax=Thalassotalea euphylliae TaxID=1655234 RepID=A0A3E0U667_9GAMM|nr:UPF0149 family protein [Thalassotalea euphylliae]REL32214.1 YecA family protein [Thalassotalea euphylliae]
MSDQSLLDFADLQATLSAESLQAHASELHGVLTGLIASGYEFESTDYIAMLNDMFNNGEGFPLAVKSAIKQVYSEIWQSLLDDSFGFKLMLPDDDDTIAERANGLGHWVQGFNLGYGLQQKDNAVASEDVKEVLSDFSEIANLSDEIDDDEATEQAYYEIAEYVKVSVLLCFAELASPPSTDDKKTIH